MGLNYEVDGTPLTTTVIQAGGIVIELMVDVTDDPQSVLDAWTTSFGHAINCFLLHDKDGMSRPALAEGNQDREWAFIVDTSTMEILWRAFGSTGVQTVEQSSAVQGLNQMCTYLGC